jgi:drug/metabolite transporter (DMT)-like permease
MFSVLYAINIAISNVSLAHVSLAFHQLLRSATPAFTIITELALFRKTRTLSIYLSLLPVVLGIGLATVDQFSDITFTWVGLFLTVIGVLLSCLKGIVTNMIMVGPLKLHPLEVIWRMALPSVIQCLLFGLAFGEWGRIPDFFTRSDEQFAFDKAGKLFVNGMLAMWLNWVSFTANQKTSALTMTVAGNVKQALSIILAVYVFNTQVTPANMAGVIIALAGGAWYRYEEALHYNTHKCSYESYSEAARSKHDYVECKEVPPI